MDQMIILATGHLIIIQITVFGLGYACQQKALSTSGESSDRILYNTTLFLLFITIPLSVILSLPVTYFAVRLDQLEIFLTYALSLALIVIKEAEVIIERASLAVDRALFINMTYSILNSVLVPLFFIINPTLESVLWAWNICLLITILIGLKSIIRVLRMKMTHLTTIKDLISFVFPLYLATVPRPFANNLNNLIIFEYLEEGATSIFYWPNRILTIAMEIILIVLTGAQEIFTHLRVRDRTVLRDSFLVVFRILSITSTVAFFLIFLNAEIFVTILLGPDYTQATPLLRLLCFAFVFLILTESLTSLKGAEAHRKVMIKANLLNLVGKVVLLLVLIQFGLEGVVFTEILISLIVFLYYTRNTDFLRINDNFIRLGIFAVLTITISGVLSLFMQNSIGYFISINFIFSLITLILFYLVRPLTTRDIIYVSKILPERFIWIISWYTPSNSVYDKLE